MTPQPVKSARRVPVLHGVFVVVMCILAILAVLLGWMGVRSLGHGTGVFESEGAAANAKGVFLLLGTFQLFGAVLALFGLFRFARTWRLLPSAKPAPSPEASIRERALANLKAAQSSRSQA